MLCFERVTVISNYEIYLSTVIFLIKGHFRRNMLKLRGSQRQMMRQVLL